jgi:RNA polymerase sigma-70 factor (ECF subfamily)
MDATMERARAGDDRAFGELTDPYLAELRLHCYQILGSVQDAEDMLQETLLAAWRGLREYEGRASLRTWLYRIATNRCLNALRAAGRAQAATARAAVPADRADSSGRTGLARAVPGHPARLPSWYYSWPGYAVRDKGNDRAGVRHRHAAPSAASAGGTAAQGRARLPVRRGSADA